MNFINLKIIFRSLLKSKFYSFLSIFGVALTFIFLTIVFIAVRQITGNITPDINKDKTISFSSIQLENGDKQAIDSVLVKNYLQLKEPEYIAYLNSQAPTVFHNEKAIKSSVGFVNADFFNIFQFEYIYGKAFSKEDEDRPVVVMTKDYALKYYGKTDVVGEEYKSQGTTFTVMGVVEDSYMFSAAKYGLYIPYRFDKFIPQRDTEHLVFLKAKDKNAVEAVNEELNRMNRHLFQQGILESSPRDADREPMSEITHTPILISIGVIIALLLLIPAFNILSLNTGRIIDQVEELSIKKAYGASKLNILKELMTENTISTAIGAMFGLALTPLFLYCIVSFINNLSSESIQFILRIDGYVVIIVIVATLVFSILSSFIPAWVVSKKQIIEGLKGGKS